MAKQVKELTDFQRIVAIITVVSLAVYSVINVALVINAYARLDDNVSQLSELISNWQVGSIVDVKVATQCPNGYESTTSSRVWPGTKQGCWCGNVAQAKLDAKNITCAPFCDGGCSADAKTLECKDVDSIPEKPLTSWGKIGGANVNTQLCVKRSAENWANSAERSTSGTCPPDYLACSEGDTLVCTKEKECPITSIVIQKISSADIMACTMAPNCAILSNDNGGPGGAAEIRKVTWKRGLPAGTPENPSLHTKDLLPLAQFKVDEYGICNLMSDDNVTPGRPLFSLLNKVPITCYTEADSRWTITDTLKEDRLFAFNGLSADISGLDTYTTSTMKGYYGKTKTGGDYKWNLYSRGYVSWNPSCRNRMQSLIEKKDLVDDMRSAQLALLIIGIIASFFLGIPLAFMEFQNLRGVDLSCIDGKGEEERTKLKRFKKFMNYFFKGLQLPFQIWAISVAGGAKGLFIDLSDEHCSDAFTNGTLNYLSETIAKTYTSTITALALLVATLLLDIVLEAWEKSKKKQQKQNAVSPNSKDEKLELTPIDGSSSSPIRYDNSPTQPPVQPQHMQPTQPQGAPAQQNIVIQIQPGQMGYPPQQQYPPQQGYPPQQYPPQQYPPQQGYPPQQYPPQQFAPQQYPPQQGYPPQQQYPPSY